MIKIEKKIEKLQTLDSSYFLGKSHFEDDGMQNYLVFQPAFKCFIAPTNMVIAWTSKGLSEESIKPADTSGNSIKPALNYISNAKIQVKIK